MSRGHYARGWRVAKPVLRSKTKRSGARKASRKGSWRLKNKKFLKFSKIRKNKFDKD